MNKSLSYILVIAIPIGLLIDFLNKDWYVKEIVFPYYGDYYYIETFNVFKLFELIILIVYLIVLAIVFIKLKKGIKENVD